jgi:hypothetical protein
MSSRSCARCMNWEPNRRNQDQCDLSILRACIAPSLFSTAPRSGLERSDFVHWPTANFLADAMVGRLSEALPTRSVRRDNFGQ